MSRLTDLIAQAKAKDPTLGSELEREFKVLSSRRSFGLNFERHRPESVELPGRPVRKGDKVHILPPRGTTAKGDQRLWKVTGFEASPNGRMAKLELLYSVDVERQSIVVADLIVVAEFKDYIYPGLVSTGKVQRGGSKPFHTVINGENFHVLEALTFTHRSKIDAIYIDPPYNSGAKDWKYNNNYVESEDVYRHSKWLAMMERRLFIAKELLNPEKSLLMVTIDEKEYLRLGLLLKQTFPDAKIQMVSSVISQKGVARDIGMNRVDEYIFFVFFGAAKLQQLDPAFSGHERAATRTQVWYPFLRTGSNSTRDHSPGCFYPVLVDQSGAVKGCGVSLQKGESPSQYVCPEGLTPIWPYKSGAQEGVWQGSTATFGQLLSEGMIKLGRPDANGVRPVMYIRTGMGDRIKRGEISVSGRDEFGAIIVSAFEGSQVQGSRTQWNNLSHDATLYGSNLNKLFVPGRGFPYPKSLYAVEDTLRWFLIAFPTATVLDFFSGSGTTAHAVMRLNRQDGGKRQCISVTNNEVGADEQAKLGQSALRPGDAEWEKWGICDYITKPRIAAAITGRTPEGEPIKGDYKFNDEFPMADGFEENAEFFTLTYETPVAVSHNRAFERIAPLLWMRAGSEGRRIDKLPDQGWEVADSYGLLIDLDKSAAFAGTIEGKEAIRVAYVVTDDDRRFQSVVRQLPGSVEPVRLYESYLTNFRFAMGR